MGHEIIRVTRRNPCPICKKGDWCGFTSKHFICMRTPSDRPTLNGGWLHAQESTSIAFKYSRIQKQSPKIPCASDPFLDKAYRAFIAKIKLSSEHNANLLARGLKESDIEYGMYRSAPNGAVIPMDYDMAIVPGFRKHASPKSWRCNAPHGILIPVRDISRRIIGMQIRLDEPYEGNKYIWLSSAKIGGPTPGARPHLALPSDARPITTPTVWITEGILKADIAALHLNTPVIGIPGVACWKNALPLIKQLNPQTVVIAYDNDYEKEQVRFHARALAENLLASGFKVNAALWRNSGYKGLDDALVAGAKINIVPVRQKEGISIA